MRHIAVIALLLISVLGCVQKPAPVANENTVMAPDEQPAIAVEYVAVPSMNVYAKPSLDAQITGTYGLTEAISVLDRKNGWCRIRTFDGIGWVQQKDLMNAQTADSLDTATPRFYVAPAAIAFRGRGEIVFQAKVNTDGAVVEVKTMKNTTGSADVAQKNADALSAAKFYPMIDKGARKTFIYEHAVYY
ncbi:MAG TPA: SH3 domain-containing protein [Thermoanaerobaculia bacterium]|nr:SH3 domain-containing protein [Thermoanaerobaculia bacterium]